MSEPESPPPAEAPSSAPARDIVSELKKLPFAEKFLAIGAVAVLVAFIALDAWGTLFKFGWFPTCSFLGSVGSLALIGTGVFGVKLMDRSLQLKILILLGILPMFGFIMDQFRGFWPTVCLIGAVAMAYAAARIASREDIVKVRVTKTP